MSEQAAAERVFDVHGERLCPLGDWVISEGLPPEEKTRGGLILPDVATAQERKRPTRLRVLAVGPGRLLDDGVTRDRIALSPGDEIIVPEYGVVIHTRPDGLEYRCHPAGRILAKVVP